MFAGVSASILLLISVVVAMTFMLGGNGGQGGCGGGPEPADHLHPNATEVRSHSHGDTGHRCTQAGEDATNQTSRWVMLWTVLTGHARFERNIR